jgi:hypothetical protein
MAPVTRAVRFLSTLHSSLSSLQLRQRSGSLLQRTFYNPDHFPKFLGVSMLLSGIMGYRFMGSIQQSEHDREIQGVLQTHQQRQIQRRFTVTKVNRSPSAKLMAAIE